MQEKKDRKIVWLVGGVIVLVVVFYAGISYGKSQALATQSANAIRGGRGNFGGRGGRIAGGFLGGEIITKDAQSITLKLTDGGSKIIFYTDQTKVMKAIDGTTADLVVGKNVSINGTTNADGSINAQSVQIRTAPPKAGN